MVIGFTPTQSDPCVYTHGSGITLAIQTLYVDDILITGKDPTPVEQKKRACMQPDDGKGYGKDTWFPRC